MTKLARAIVLAIIVVAVGFLPRQTAAQTEGDYLYNVTLLRAAPGHFTELIETLRESFEMNKRAGDPPPFWIRHSQGDHWDFILIYPVGSHADYFMPSRIDRRGNVWMSATGREITARLEGFTAYTEEWFATSISRSEMERRFEGMGMFHIEMFAGLAGKRADLIEQRRMENKYYEHLNRQQNVIFVRDSGSNWDVMTIGFHESLESFAAAGNKYSEEEQSEAARAAGFDDVNQISPYLRSLLSYHNDTIGVSIR
jgi:hypothetical protein